MTRITYRPHLLRRLRERKVPKDYPKKIYQQAKKYYLDRDTQHFLAVSDLKYAEKIRHLVVAYDISSRIATLIYQEAQLDVVEQAGLI